MKPLKKIALVAILSTFLTACMSTQQINAEASQGYRQMKQQNAKAIDTSSVTAQRVHKIFNKMKPYAEQENKTGVPSNGKLLFFVPMNSMRGQCLVAKWASIRVWLKSSI